ncbi:hypothetical protein EZ428_03670 [Pedobacter frigiditerrae]|uniref:MetA-pathway of phenol degradation n=1 Tax=Pedobacter frigiditerrae TaxID=2530452 RepID=A0A4R0N255_9SPHI|nr:hypothetical protein [Pedobacter frigiditerrae]TCC93881.1 hypothetical protein EZ428_03670 [Pedobacter frigiditerrae]
MKKNNIISIVMIAVVVFILLPKISKAQDPFENGLKLKVDSMISAKAIFSLADVTLLPNNGTHSIMTPTGWVGNSTYLFALLGGVFPAEYVKPNKGDLIGSFGIGFGNPSKYFGISASVNITRITELRDFSGNIILSRKLFKASSIAIGGVQLFANQKVSDAPDGTYYISFSHAVQSVKSSEAGYSGLIYTIGIGNGRFLYKSPWDIASGKGKHGTGIFANVSYEVLKNVNVNVEWSGLNLGFSTGFQPVKDSPLIIGLGVYNLTKNSGDRVSMIGTIGCPFSLSKSKK